MKFWKPALLTGITFGLLMAFPKVFFDESVTTPRVITNVITGVLFGILYMWLAQRTRARELKKIEITFSPGESVVKEAVTNHYVKHKRVVVGKLVLTNQRLIFKPNQPNYKIPQLDIPLDTIESMSTAKSLMSWKNALLVTSSGAQQKFMVTEPEEWTKVIGRTI